MPLNFKNSYKKLPEVFYKETLPEATDSPKLLLFNKELALSLDFDYLESEALNYLSGNKTFPESTSIALAYSGHQFGHFVPLLGDGRAVLIADFESDIGHKDLQLKGSGVTPYSRRGDGKAPLSAALREYLLSEAMYALKIPTTRALSVVKTSEKVIRQKEEAAGIIARVSNAHLRVGTFEFASANNSNNELKELADYSIKRLYSKILKSKNLYEDFFGLIVKKQAELIVDWMSVGFIHGVMNTDNMNIACETIDYGPCAFMNYYNKRQVYSYIDREGRYAYSNQPKIGLWNLARLGEVLLPLFSKDEKKAINIAENILNKYFDIFNNNFVKKFSNKLGFNLIDQKFIEEFLNILESQKLDFTLSFKFLESQLKPNKLLESIFSNFSNNKMVQDFVKKWLEKIEDKDVALELMEVNNPYLIPRNHLVDSALVSASEEDDLSEFSKLNEYLKNPYSLQKIDLKYYLPPEEGEDHHKYFCGLLN
ncbi:UNVERIFIED_CONTAM: hypothetical protein GTU68_017255 [Idotea baltica]|nr:hypothetical protein [Idotea baltica]